MIIVNCTYFLCHLLGFGHFRALLL